VQSEEILHSLGKVHTYYLLGDKLKEYFTLLNSKLFEDFRFHNISFEDCIEIHMQVSDAVERFMFLSHTIGECLINNTV
jgi:hypothetical protein